MTKQKSTSPNIFSIPVPTELESYAASAITRLGYIFPATYFSLNQATIDVETSDDPILIRRDVLHAIYRERIRSETEDIRSSLIRALVSK